MVTIRKGNHKLTVSKETYLSMFKELGYELDDKSTKKDNKVDKSNIKNTKKEIKKQPKEEKSKMDDFLDNVCDNNKNDSTIKIDEKKETDEEVSDILSIMSKEKENKEEL